MKRLRVIAAALLVLAAAGSSAQEARHGRLFPPENLGDLEGPDGDAYQMPEAIMDALGIADGSHVADIGAGGGWFTVRLARRVGPNGIVYAQDVQPQMVEAIRRRVVREGLRNVRTVQGDPVNPRLEPATVEAILIVDTYHEFRENGPTLLKHLASALKPGGRLGIVEYTKAGGGPGPPAEDRMEEAHVVRDAEAAGLRLASRETFLPFQYFVVFEHRRSGPPVQAEEAPDGGKHQAGKTDLRDVSE
jgi:SAM-dependent methyltransferase